MREPQHLERRLADAAFYVLLAATVLLTGWLGARHDRYWDWTQSERHTLSAESQAVIARLDAPLRITVFLERAHPLAKGIEQVLARYRRSVPDLDVRFVDPQLFPEQARAAEVSLLGQMLVEYRGRRETVTQVGEGSLTGAIARLTRRERPWVVSLEGHGERSISGEAGTDLGRLAALLGERGYRIRPLDLATQPQVPDNAAMLVISTPAIPPFPGEVERLTAYLAGGGNLLWLMDPGGLQGLEPLANALAITPLPGLLVDANVQRLAIDDPTVGMVSRFPDHPLTRGIAQPALFPGCLAFLPVAAPDWTLATPLETLGDTWNETGPIRGEIAREGERGEQPGPLPVALALTRARPEGGEQRVLVLGDGDFLSNAHLETAGNRALALRLIEWLTAPEDSAPVTPRELPDRTLALTRADILVIGGGSLVVGPLLFLAAGLLVRRRRRRE
jgi:hypothetical protein